MELDDMFLMGKRPITLRLVLGLMEDADNSLETYRWATPALLHSIHTKDTTLSDYVKEVFDDVWNLRLGLGRWGGYQLYYQ